MTTARRATAAAALLALAGTVVLSACGSDEPGASGSQSTGAVETAVDRDGVQVLEVKAGDDLRFQQTDLRATTGKIKINLDVTGRVPHNLAFTDGNKGSTGTTSDATTSVTLQFDKPGTYHFLCTIHPKMRGTLTVS
ncbi:MAG TPA: cupredoxin domain-containing protein [Mycobacteriales bacterium]|nr:cupredoxin domain-containing protein [Mycobacteriales bacterium]